MDTQSTSSLPPPDAARASALAPGAWLGPVVLVAVAVLLELGGADWREALRYDRAAIADGELWRLLTGNFVHLGAWHLFLNALSLVLLVMLCPEPLSPGEWLLRSLVLCLGMSAGLYEFAPQLGSYVGLSGMIYGLFVLGLGRQAVAGDRIAVLCLLFLAGRIGWELTIGAPDSEETLIGGRVVAESHLYGAISAAIYGIVRGVFRPPPRSAGTAADDADFGENIGPVAESTRHRSRPPTPAPENRES